MLSELVSIVIPVYLCAGMGFVWVRSGRHYDTAFMTDMVMLVGAPCLAFSSLAGGGLDFALLLSMLNAAIVAIACMAVLAALVLWLARIPLKTFLAPMVFGNTGNMGIPVCYFAFGDEGLALAVCVFAATSVVQFSAGVWMWSGELSARQLIRTPLLWASGLALGVVGLDVPVPGWLMRTTSLMGDFTVPIMQFTLGVSLARLEVTSVRRTLGLSCFKLGMGAGVGWLVAWSFGFEGARAGVLILDCAMPVAVFNYMFASKYGRSPAEVASVIVLSTLLAFATLPLLLGWLLPGLA